MRFVDKSKYVELQKKPSQIRNVCILAHVDHGKTTLADSLIASNGIISQKMAGKLRYMDSRTDEQEKGITMKSSCISLYYHNAPENKEFIVNLIDSPGHIDFSSEVSTAVRLCDGAIVLVDVVEGVCSQTRLCLKQAYSEHLHPVLVLNKIDRLILEKKMEPLDAYIHISQVLENVNAVVGNLFASDILSKDISNEDIHDHISPLENADDSDLYFAPEQGNVVFASALDNWAFRLEDFAKIYSSKLGMTCESLVERMWGNYYYSTKEKKVLPGAQEKAKKPVFVQFILENIWKVYDTVVVRKEKEQIPVIAEKIGVKLLPRDLRSTDPKVHIQAIFTQWLPIDRTVLQAIIKIIPSPEKLSSDKVDNLMCPKNQSLSSYPLKTQALKSEFMVCNPNSENTIAFISKMIPFPRATMPENKAKPLSEEDILKRREIARQRHQERMEMELSGQISELSVSNETPSEAIPLVTENLNDESNEVFVAFARVFSGTLKKGMKILALAPKHDPRDLRYSGTDSPYVFEVTIDGLYLFMGRDLEDLDEVPAGNIIGISGLGHAVLKTATLSNNISCPSFSELTIIATPIFKVAVEPVNTADMPKLVKGLKLLNQSDACVKVMIQETGEHVIVTLGEVHLERCIRDLEEDFCKIKLNVSKPIVPFQETIVLKQDDPTDKTIEIYTMNKQHKIRLLAVPIPDDAIKLLEQNVEIIKIMSNAMTHQNTIIDDITIALIDKFKTRLTSVLEGAFPDIPDFINRIWSFGPRKCGPNILLNATDFSHTNCWQLSSKSDDLRNELQSTFVNGFQLASQAGPLCEEPMYGVCIIVKEWSEEVSETAHLGGPISGQIISSVRDGCRKAFQNQSQRLVTPMYSCRIIVNEEVLGKLYAVLGRRHGKVVASDLTEGSGTFSVTAVIPVVESFNFAQEIRKHTSGLACPQLVFSHWEMIDIDPFWVPITEEEYLHYGEKADYVNRAKVYLESVRKRKGLAVEEKIVEHAEKQRTLSKNK